MKKRFIKKIIVSTCFISFLVLLFSFINIFKCNNDISLVKSIIKNKYKSVNYDKKTKYLYAYKDGEYEVYDNNGNKLYSIFDDSNLNIISVTKNYYVIYIDKYYVYNTQNDLFFSSDDVYSLNSYLFKSNDKVLDYKGNVVLENINKIESFNGNKLFNVNNKYIIDKRGNIILKDSVIKEEVKNKNKFYIIKKGKKYYTFFPNIEKIIGTGFNDYRVEKKIFIEDENDKYIILKSGIRKKISEDNYPRNEYVSFNNKYKTVKASNKYTLLDKNNNIIKELDEQIIVKNSKVKKGNINKTFYLYDIKSKKYYKAKTFYIKNNKYYLYKKDNNSYLLDSNFKEIRKSSFIDIYKNYIIYKDNNKLVFLNVLKNKKKTISIKNEELAIDSLYKNILVLKAKDEIKVLNYKGNTIKIIKDNNIKDIYFDSDNNRVVIITMKDGLIGSYVCE